MEKLISDTLAALPPEEQNGPLAALLPALFSGNQKKALDASYELWVLLCNQGQVIPAALPVYDLLVMSPKNPGGQLFGRSSSGIGQFISTSLPPVTKTRRPLPGLSWSSCNK